MHMDGIVKTFQHERGFGFIAIEGEKKNLFFHIKDFPHREIMPQIGEKVRFEIVEAQGKLRAVDIMRLDLKSEAVREAPQSRTLSNFDQQKSRLEHSRADLKVEVVRHTPQSRALANLDQQSRRREGRPVRSAGNWIRNIGIIVMVCLAYAVYHKYQVWKNNQPEQIRPVQKIIAEPLPENNFKCDGREHCSQMSSYEEALFFIRHCPNTKMDGDQDGIPCESQF